MSEGGAGPPPVKTAKQLEKEAKKAEEKAAKMEKFKAKQQAKVVEEKVEKKEKKEKPKKEEKIAAVYSSNTKIGEKKDTKVNIRFLACTKHFKIALIHTYLVLSSWALGLGTKKIFLHICFKF